MQRRRARPWHRRGGKGLLSQVIDTHFLGAAWAIAIGIGQGVRVRGLHESNELFAQDDIAIQMVLEFTPYPPDL